MSENKIGVDFSFNITGVKSLSPENVESMKEKAKSVIDDFTDSIKKSISEEHKDSEESKSQREKETEESLKLKERDIKVLYEFLLANIGISRPRDWNFLRLHSVALDSPNPNSVRVLDLRYLDINGRSFHILVTLNNEGMYLIDCTDSSTNRGVIEIGSDIKEVIPVINSFLWKRIFQITE